MSTVIRKSNGKASCDFLIILRLMESAGHADAEKWLIGCLGKFKSLEFRLIPAGAPSEDDPWIESQFLLHIEGTEKYDEEGLIVISERPSDRPIHADLILSALTNVPDEVVGIGVSAISPTLAKDYWRTFIEGIGDSPKGILPFNP